MTPAFSIRPEQAADAAAIQRVTIEAFAGAEHAAGTEHRIVAALRAADALAISLVAESAGEIVGHVAVSPVTLSGGERNWYGLGPISVAPPWQRRGVGSALMRAALAGLRGRQAAGCILVGDPCYYERFGFRAAPTLSYPGVPGEYLLALAMAAKVPAGVVSFHGAFAIEA